MTIFYVIVFISGLLGNIFVILVITRSRGLHCAMNFYLLSLALADILIIVLGTSSVLPHAAVSGQETFKGLLLPTI